MIPIRRGAIILTIVGLNHDHYESSWFDVDRNDEVIGYYHLHFLSYDQGYEINIRGCT